MSSSRTVIVGGGIVGLCAAYYLARRGERVTLLEQGPIDQSASTGNAGLIALGHGPLPRPGLTRRALRWMLEPTSPLYIPPRLDLPLLRWLWQFHRACGPAHHKASLDLLSEHGHPAGACFRDLVETESIACGYQPRGRLEVYATAAGLRAGEHEAAVMRDYGYDVEILPGDALREREPAFREEVVGAALFKDSAFADPQAFVLAMADRAQRRGAEVRTPVKVADLLVDDGRCVGVRTGAGERIEADRVLLAAGAWTTDLARRIGVPVPMQPAKGYHLNVTRPAPCLRTACVLSECFVAVTPLGDGLRLAGTLEFSGLNHRFVPARVRALRRGARAYLHGLDETHDLAAWCGLRPCTADGLPILGFSPRVPNLFIATGHAMMGFALGPLAGRLACECLLDGRPSLDLGRLGPGRFEADRRPAGR